MPRQFWEFFSSNTQPYIISSTIYITTNKFAKRQIPLSGDIDRVVWPSHRDDLDRRSYSRYASSIQIMLSIRDIRGLPFLMILGLSRSTTTITTTLAGEPAVSNHPRAQSDNCRADSVNPTSRTTPGWLPRELAGSQDSSGLFLHLPIYTSETPTAQTASSRFIRESWVFLWICQYIPRL